MIWLFLYNHQRRIDMPTMTLTPYVLPNQDDRFVCDSHSSHRDEHKLVARFFEHIPKHIKSKC